MMSSGPWCHVMSHDHDVMWCHVTMMDSHDMWCHVTMMASIWCHVMSRDHDVIHMSCDVMWPWCNVMSNDYDGIHMMSCDVTWPWCYPHDVMWCHYDVLLHSNILKWGQGYLYLGHKSPQIMSLYINSEMRVPRALIKTFLFGVRVSRIEGFHCITCFHNLLKHFSIEEVNISNNTQVI